MFRSARIDAHGRDEPSHPGKDLPEPEAATSHLFAPAVCIHTWPIRGTQSFVRLLTGQMRLSINFPRKRTQSLPVPMLTVKPKRRH